MSAVTALRVPGAGITFHRERICDGREEAWPLIEAHYAEIAHYHDIALDPDWESYDNLEAAGGLRTYTARADNALVGYAVFIVHRNMHFKGSVQALQDVLYLDPCYRRGRVGMALISFAENCLRGEGVQVVYHHVRITTPYGRVFERLGYDPISTLYGKRLDGGP